MTNLVNVRVLENGPRNIIIAVFLKSDGATGELEDVTLVDPVALGLPVTTRFGLRYIDYNLAGFDATIQFASGGVVPNYQWQLVEGANNPADFDWCGGLWDNSGIDGTGKLQISTVGFTSTTDSGSILIKLIKPTNTAVLTA